MEILHPPPSDPAGGPWRTEETYTQPQRHHWPVYDDDVGAFVDAMPGDDRFSMLELSEDECRSLEILNLFVKYQKQKGESGKAATWNYKKVALPNVAYNTVAVAEAVSSDKAKAAYDWLMRNQPAYKYWIGKQAEHLREKARNPRKKDWLQTAELLLHSDGIEVACRPILYPRAAYGDTDLRDRLVGSYLSSTAIPQAKTHYLRKSLSLCAAYVKDTALTFLIRFFQ